MKTGKELLAEYFVHKCINNKKYYYQIRKENGQNYCMLSVNSLFSEHVKCQYLKTENEQSIHEKKELKQCEAKQT